MIKLCIRCFFSTGTSILKNLQGLVDLLLARLAKCLRETDRVHSVTERKFFAVPGVYIYIYLYTHLLFASKFVDARKPKFMLTQQLVLFPIYLQPAPSLFGPWHFYSPRDPNFQQLLVISGCSFFQIHFLSHNFLHLLELLDRCLGDLWSWFCTRLLPENVKLQRRCAENQFGQKFPGY